MRKDFVFISESVTAGHPDKLCDQISDAIIDHFLVQDPNARVRAECAVSKAIIFIAARFASSATVDCAQVARKVINEVGYNLPDFNAKTCSILSTLQEVTPDPKSFFDESKLNDEEIDEVLVKNQATLFGFACDQTSTFMPLTIHLAHKLSRRLCEVRRQNILPYLLPDGRVQAAVEYKNRTPYRIQSIIISTSQEKPDDPQPEVIRQDLLETVINPAFADEELKFDEKTRIFINPDGPIIIGGPSSHSGLTGRKNAVDTYGEYSRQSQKALSGKDPLRIDRAGVYMARYAAKNVVAAGLARECEVQLSYSIGLAKPLSIQVETFGTGKLPESKIVRLLDEHFDFRLASILKQFNLRHLPALNPLGFYQKLASYGQVGRVDMDLPWEKTDKASLLNDAAALPQNSRD